MIEINNEVGKSNIFKIKLPSRTLEEHEVTIDKQSL